MSLTGIHAIIKKVKAFVVPWPLLGGAQNQKIEINNIQIPDINYIQL